MAESNPYFPAYPLPWEMSVAERFALTGLLAQWRPAVALEIGTHFGGSLQVLVTHSAKVYSIDLDPAVQRSLEMVFPQVVFAQGSSRQLIPQVLAGISERGESLEFVLVDGDHSAAGVEADIHALLAYRPAGPLRILLHDSFNPDCRAGMRRARWEDCPHVHSVELDFIPGTFHAKPQGGAFARSMWGGFALAELRPEPRQGPLEIRAGQEELHGLTFRNSAHRVWHKAWRAFRRRTGS